MSGTELTIRLERWGTFWPEAAPLLALHHLEVGISKAPDPDEELTKWAIETGAMLVWGARVEGRLVGYCSFFISQSLEHKGRLVAQQGPWFVLHEWRAKAGLRLMNEALRTLKVRVQQVFIHHWEKSDPRLGQYFERLGAQKTEIVYSLDFTTDQGVK